MRNCRWCRSRIDTFGPMIFVNPDRMAPPLSQLVGDLAKVVTEQAGVDLSRLKWARRDVYDLAANWKIAVENFNECYHCPVAHPKFSTVIDTDDYRIDTGHEFFSTYYGPFLGEQHGGVTYAALWPNAMLSFSSNPPSMMMLCAEPIDADHTREFVDYYFADCDERAGAARLRRVQRPGSTRGHPAVRIGPSRDALARHRQRPADALARTRRAALPEPRLSISQQSRERLTLVRLARNAIIVRCEVMQYENRHGSKKDREIE